MIRAVIDTNVFVSGAAGFQQGESTPGDIVRRWRRQEFVLIASAPIIDEIARTLATPYFLRQSTPDIRGELMDALVRDAKHAVLTSFVEGAASHPEDDLILATAISGRADYLVTGDRNLQRLGSYRSVSMVSPREFLAILPAELSC